MMHTSPQSGAISKKLVIIAGCLLLVLGSLYFTVISRGDNQAAKKPVAATPTQAADEFLAAVIKRDGAAAYANFTDRLQKDFTVEGWQAQVDETFAEYGNAKPVYVNTETLTETNDDTPTSEKLTYNLTFKKLGNETNVTYEIAITVVREGGSWRINEFSGKSI